MSEKIICEKCGTEMQPHHKDSTCGMLCPNCGWGWVTTCSSPIDADETMYTISFCKPEKTTAAMVKLYAKLTEQISCRSKKPWEKVTPFFLHWRQIFKSILRNFTLLGCNLISHQTILMILLRKISNPRNSNAQ